MWLTRCEAVGSVGSNYHIVGKCNQTNCSVQFDIDHEMRPNNGVYAYLVVLLLMLLCAVVVRHRRRWLS